MDPQGGEERHGAAKRRTFFSNSLRSEREHNPVGCDDPMKLIPGRFATLVSRRIRCAPQPSARAEYTGPSSSSRCGISTPSAIAIGSNYNGKMQEVVSSRRPIHREMSRQ